MENLVIQNKVVITKKNVSFIFCKTATQTKTIDFEKLSEAYTRYPEL